MRAHKPIGFLAGMVILLSLTASFALVFASDGKQNRETLGGLKAVYLQVAPIDRDMEDKGLTKRGLRQDIEKRLSRAGIKMLTDREYEKNKSIRSYPLARLELIATVHEIPDKEINVYNVTVQVRQVVWLARKPTVNFVGTTWRHDEFGHGYGFQEIREKVNESVDSFIDAFLSANRK